MAIDRTRTLRHAEKLLRQGQLDAAIGEYQRVLAEFPHDWTTANALGDCYYRAHQADKAVEQYIRIADHLMQDGLVQPAGVLYRKILKITPAHEHALLQAATAASAQGAVADARQWLTELADLRRARGDAAGAAEALVRVGSLDPADLDARLAAARELLATGGGDRVVSEVRDLADALFVARRDDEAIALLGEGLASAPRDAVLSGRLARAFAERGDFESARAHAATAPEFLQLADACATRGDAQGAIAMLTDAHRLASGDVSITVRLVRACADQGDYATACAHLDAVGDVFDAELFAVAGEVRAHAGDFDRARALFARLLAREPHRTAALIEQGLAMADPNLALVHVEPAADAQLARGDTFGAIAAYARFADTFPAHLPALVRLVDISVDAGLEQETADAQGRLADAYLDAGRAPEARVIAEDLLSRYPTDPQQEQRLRRALVAMGEPHVDAIIAERLNTGNVLGFEEFPVELPDPSAQATATGDEAQASAPAPGAEPPGAAADTAAAGAAADGGESFRGFHDDVTRQALLTAAEQHYKVALAYEAVGMPDEAAKELQAAVRSPRRRFEAAAMLARLSRAGGSLDEAVYWFERAAEAPAPSIEACRRLLYDFADALEAAGEDARAVEVFRELQAESGAYRDVVRRIEQLTRGRRGSGG